MISHDTNNTEETPYNDQILTVLRNMLPDIARRLIASKQDMSDPRQQAFKTDPDNPAEHSPLWHQYGILTHSKEFQTIIKSGLSVLSAQWNISNEVKAALSEEIQGVSKADLLQIASLLHDLGKFTTRVFERQEDGTLLAKFVGHETDSGAIVRTELKDVLQKMGMHEQQIEYIARCTEHHFDLGKARQVAIDNGGYTMTFARSETFKKVAQDMIKANPELALEVGLMFIADSLSKTRVMATADTDEGINAQRSALEQEIKQKGLDSRLINQALQQPVNVEIGRQYLQTWVDICGLCNTSWRLLL
jgi:hypothetical protein